jgi:oligoendopeptidase F
MPTALPETAPVHAAAAEQAGNPNLGQLPGWNLADLYPGPQSNEFTTDLAAARSGAKDFETRWKGGLEQAAETAGGSGLGAAIEAYEQLEELMGRIISYAGLNYFTDSSDPANAKFYGDVQSAITDISAHLLFFALELNRIDDSLVEDCLQRDPRARRYAPWIRDLRLDKPFQLEDRIEQLFHEKSMTGRAAWNRLFDETMAGLQFEIDGEDHPLEVTLSLLQDADGEKRKKAGQALAATFNQNLRTFTLITNTLAKDKEISDRWRGFQGCADSRHLANRVEGPVVEALVDAVTEKCPQSRTATTRMKAKWLGMDQLAHWDRNAPLPDKPERVKPSPGPRPRTWCFPPITASRPEMATYRAKTSSTSGGSMRRRGRARRRARSRIRPCPRCTPMCCSIISANRAM